MRQHLFALVAGLISSVAMETAIAGQEHPYAAEHINGLPADVRRAVITHERACGVKAAAAHYFSVSIETSALSFLSLHYENFYCPNKNVLCTASGCLHEIYAGGARGYRRVFSIYAEDTRLTKIGGVVGLEVGRSGSAQLYWWDGGRFVPAR